MAAIFLLWNMIDIHTHVIYGVDDGSASPDMSRDMLRRASEQGVTALACTSHCTPGYRPFPRDRYLNRLEELQGFANREGLPLRLLTGCEILYTDRAVSMIRGGEIPTLNGTDRALVEFLPEASWDTVRRAVREFGNAGLRMVAAHVERYDCLRENLLRLREMRDEGVLCQMNAETAVRSAGLFGDRWARKALKSGLIDAVASDAHNLSSRAPNLKEARQSLEKAYGGEMARRLLEEGPREILNI